MRKKEEIFITNNFEETQKLGEKFIKRLHLDKGATLSKRRTVCLYGDLGSGKTTFVQGMARRLGIKRRIISPTFIIIRSYKLKTQMSKVKTTRLAKALVLPKPSAKRRLAKRATQKSKLFYHIDLYRVEGVDNIKGLGVGEIINDSQNIIAIEWAEKMGKMLPKKRWEVRFEHAGESGRRIAIKSRT